MSRVLKILFFALLVKPLVLVIIGLNSRFRHKLPTSGPAVIAANHNSHLDTFILISLYPLAKIHRLRPVAAAEYFLSKNFLAWFSLNIIGIIPIDRKNSNNRDEMLNACHDALDQGDILILFPEGTRGEPEKTSELKKGIYHLIKDRNDTKITPVMIHGLGRSLPKGEALFVPFNCDVVVGDALPKSTTADELINQLSNAYEDLKSHCITLNRD